MSCCCCCDSEEDVKPEFDTISPFPVLPPRVDPADSKYQVYVNDPEGSPLKLWTVDFRKFGAKADDKKRPEVGRGQLWKDLDFPLYVAIRESEKLGLLWKRPTEIISDPVLFEDGAARSDVRQKYFGTCWFLSMMSALADKPELFTKVLNERSWKANGDGICHTRLWRLGNWEDVYIDDYLPVYVKNRGYRMYGAMSDSDPREMWVSLLEKSLAKLHGSYNVVSDTGGYPTDAYLTLTGGVPERVNLEKDGLDPIKLFNRISRALQNGALITCAVPKKNDKKEGLVGGHAYTLTGAHIVVRDQDKQRIPILRIRNPYGAKEWNGKWSDQSVAWRSVSGGEGTRTGRDDGEFWIGMEDFLKYFNQTSICSLSPDFDKDGKSDQLKYVLRIYGEWTILDAAGEGRSIRQRLRNPRFEITVPTDKNGTTDYIPIVIQLIQDAKNQETDSIRCDVFKIYHGGDTSRTLYLRQEQDEDNRDFYYQNLQNSFRFWLQPGKYIIIPSTYQEGSRKQFLIRVYTQQPLEKCRKISSRVSLIPR